MSVLTITGSSAIPGYPRAAPLNYTPPTARRIQPSGSANAATPAPDTTYNYTRTDRRTNTVRSPQTQPTPYRHSRPPSSSLKSPSSSSSFNVPAAQTPHSSTHSRQSSVASSTMNMQRQPTGASINSNMPRRSTSGRSVATNSPTSYVALMRKQKATVWCDRAQTVDVRTEAARRAAKHRAQLAVQSSASSAGGRTSTLSSGGVVGKIRHGGVPKAPYVPANMSGAGVPMRLSANEMLGDEEEEQGYTRGDNAMLHGRSSSGKSSTHSTQYRSGYPRPDVARFSSNSTPPSGEGSPNARDRIPEESHPAPEEDATDYYASREKADSLDEDSFGGLGELAGPNSALIAAKNAKNAEDLRRRGSVDERTMSMGAGVKLFVANPDIDSD